MDNMLDRIEKQRVLLEENVAKLRKALRHWQTLELDYEGLKDEFQVLPEKTTTKAQFLEAAHDFGPETVDDKELHELIESKGQSRLPSQVVDTLTKRIEYVRRNVESLRKQLATLEKERNAVLLAQNSDHAQSEVEGDLEHAEITEQLDEEGNVLSSHVQRVDDTATKVLDVMDRGMKPGPEQSSASKEDANDTKPTTNPRSRVETASGTLNDSNGIKQEGETSLSEKPDHDSDEDSSLSEPASESTPFDTTANLTLQPTNPDDDENEARLRQEMLQYGLPEVGNIVAELELAEGDGFDDFDDIDDDTSDPEDEYDDSDDEESEDEYGRSKRPAMSAKYRRKMEELQKRLSVKMENVGPSSNLPAEIKESNDRPSAAVAARKAAIARQDALKTAIKEKDDSNTGPPQKKPKKKVAFAPALDIAKTPPKDTSISKSRVINENITERTTIDTQDTELPKPARISRFKATRAAQPQTPLMPPPMELPRGKQDAPEGPAGKTIAETLIERPGPKNASDVPAPDGDDFDEELQKRQIALEHHRLRNRMIHEQGGYVGGGELENWGEEYAAPTVEDEKTGQPRKISRFKAARMKG
ncbi:hypothetical protein H2198_004459 [Neophaeococcomyces mojaviensis]|uniref:Uncharacterized protein n=1 Tax=Neophaeococcomyces mojaviensis TaxID=3383035 RepID=A0ACC3A910_9EURO|nr:hypothetical protein H2198_004459 [Knufia sp. JES_112]